MTTTNELPAAPPRRHESPEVGAACARMMRALVVRSAEGDLEALEQLAALSLLAPEAVTLAGNLAYVQAGYSHGLLAKWLGISRQASAKRFGRAAGGEWIDWLSKRRSSGSVMRELVGQLAERRTA